MKSHRLLSLSTIVLVMGVAQLSMPNNASAIAAKGAARLCGPNCYYVCPGRDQLEADCQFEGSGCHSSYNCGAGLCGSDGTMVASDC